MEWLKRLTAWLLAKLFSHGRTVRCTCGHDHRHGAVCCASCGSWFVYDGKGDFLYASGRVSGEPISPQLDRRIRSEAAWKHQDSGFPSI